MNQDPSLALLLNELRAETQAALWIADEHAANLQLPAKANIEVISNRFDVASNLSNQGWRCQFSDLNCQHIPKGSLSRLYFRLAKEKPQVHHVINLAAELLKENGELIFSGSKQQGIKNYAKQAVKHLGGKGHVKKHGNEYLAIITRGATTLPLDDKNYAQIRPTLTYNGINIVSKPGQFGWNKLDQGSCLLAEQFSLATIQPPTTILDLGCGYGFLALAAHQQWPEATITATDNNAAALLSCRKNFSIQHISGDIVAADCANTITQKHDLIICNPPFHQGFAIAQQLTEKFISNAHRLCQTDGNALFVVNGFIPLERIATNYFNDIQLLMDSGSFKLFQLKP